MNIEREVQARTDRGRENGKVLSHLKAPTYMIIAARKSGMLEWMANVNCRKVVELVVDKRVLLNDTEPVQ